MKKILYIVSTLKQSGPTNQLRNIIKNLDPSVFNPVIVTLSPEPKDSQWEKYESLGVKMHSLNHSRLGGLIFAKSRLEKLIKLVQPDLIHTQGIRADVLSSRLKSGIPKIATIRNFPQKDFPMTYGNFLGKQMVHRQSSALKKLNTCVGVSEAVTANLITTFGLCHSQAIQNGIDTEVYLPVDDAVKLELRTKIGLPHEPKIWIVSGSLNGRKDPLFLINAWKQFFANNTKQYLVLIGGGDLQENCLQAAEGEKNIKVLGRVTNVVEYLQASDYYLAASKAEGMPNAALEALACGLPLLLSDIGPHNELVKMDEQIGLTYKIDNLDDFYGQVNKLRDRDYKTMRSACLSLVSTSLSATVMSQKYQALYMKLMSKG